MHCQAHTVLEQSSDASGREPCDGEPRRPHRRPITLEIETLEERIAPTSFLLPYIEQDNVYR